MAKIELRPHVGMDLATRQEVDLNQDRIYVDGRAVGYVGRKPDAPINLVRRGLGPVMYQEIQAAVLAKYGGKAEKISEPVELPDEYDGDDDLESE